MVIIRKALIAILLLISIAGANATDYRAVFDGMYGQEFIWISLYNGRSAGKLYYIDSYGKTLYTTSISSGSAGFRTPAGIHKIYYKKLKHMSTKYPEPSGINNMDYSLFFKGGFALHQGNPRASSHGCVHVAPGMAQQLYTDARHGTTVIITRTELPSQTKAKQRRQFMQSRFDHLLDQF